MSLFAFGPFFWHRVKHQGWAGAGAGGAPPWLPHSQFSVTLSHLGVGAGVWGAAELPPPAAPDAPGASSSVCSSPVHWRGGINSSGEMNNLSKVEGKGRFHLGEGFNEGAGTNRGQSCVSADLHWRGCGLGDPKVSAPSWGEWGRGGPCDPTVQRSNGEVKQFRERLPLLPSLPLSS